MGTSTIPLFTFAGYLMARAKTAERLVRMSKAVLGWFPGGLAVMTVWTCAFFTVFTGIRQVDRRLVERVVTLGGDRWALVRHVYLPSVAAWVLGNLKIAVGFAFTGACVGEFVAATHGLGYLLSFAQSTYNAALMFALILLILVVVLLIFGVAGRLEKYLLRWN